MGITKEDFYCGAFLSSLLNNGIVPALFEEDEIPNRKIYDFTTNKGSFRVYVKYSEKPTSSSDTNNTKLWNFPFTDKQLEEVKKLRCEPKKAYFIFVCGNLSLNQTKIAVVDHDDVLKCINVTRIDKYKDQSIKIKLTKGEHNFQIYGTARADKLSGKDNMIKVSTKNCDIWL